MYAPGKPKIEFETSSADFSEQFAFTIESDLTKVIKVTRHANAFEVVTQYADIAIFEETRETFEADGDVSISATDSGIYITSYRSVLGDRVRLRRTRFF